LAIGLLLWCWAQPVLAATDPTNVLQFFRDAPVVSVVTFGPGDVAFSKFGHNAIRVQDKQRRTDLVYNFGTFRFDSPLLIVDFLTGKFRYWLSVTPFQRTLESYVRQNRSVLEQRLNLSPWAANDLNDALIENAKPENASYVYDYYRDNCSTRVRDAVDRVLKGELERRFDSPARATYRDHTLRLVADDVWLYVGLDLAMGPLIDQPISRYDEMFLPQKLSDGIGGVTFSGVHGVAPLVSETKRWNDAVRRPPLRRRPPDRTFDFFKVGAAIGAFITFVGWESYRRRQRWAEVLLPLLFALLGLVVGVLGLVLLGLWVFTNHEVTYRNENLLQCQPWALGFTVAAYGLFRGRLRWVRTTQRLAAGSLSVSVLGLVLKAVPLFQQQNQHFIALFLPIWLGVFVASTWMQEKVLRVLRLRTAQALPADADPDARESSRPPSDPPSDDGDEEEDEPKDRPPSTVPPQPAPA
jgi:hypothetical protein